MTTKPTSTTRLVATSAGPVEITRTEGDRPAILFFPGGHCRSSTDCGQGIYTAHAEDLRAHLGNSELVELPSPTHLFWFGPGDDVVADAVRRFLDHT